jgi:hypothetical protein
MQHFEIDKKWIHFIQIMLKEHAWERWMFHKWERFNLFETLTWEEFKVVLRLGVHIAPLGASRWDGVLTVHPKGQ